MSVPLANGRFIRFDDYVLNLESGELFRKATPIKLQAQPFKILALLAGRAGTVVTREEIKCDLWSEDTFVDFDKGIYYCVKEIRRALGDDAEKPRYVETLPGKGYRFVAPVEIKEVSSAPPAELRQEAESGGAWEKPRPAPRRRRRAALVAVVAIASGAALGIWLLTSREPALPMTVTPLTSDAVEEGPPDLSPDGKLVAFTRVIRDAAGRYRSADLYVKQVAGGEPLRVAEGVEEGELAWSPDSQEVAFFREFLGEDGGSGDAIVAVPALGGSERTLVTAYQTWEEGGARHASVDWSPDGTLLAITDIDGPRDPPAIHLVSLENGEKERLTRPPRERPYGDESPRFSPDGRTVAFVRGDMPESEIYLVPTRGGEARRLTSGNWLTSGLGWAADGRSLVFSSTRAPRGGVFGLWRVPIGGGDPEPLAVGEGGQGPTISRSGNRLAYLRADTDRDIWRVGGPTADESERRRPHRFISSTWWDWAPEYSPDGQSILFTSHRSGFGEVWVADADGSHPRQLTFLKDTATTTVHGWSPDGRQVALMSGKEGNWDVYLSSASGGSARRLTTSPANEHAPSWSRDGRWIYYATDQSGRTEVWKMRPDGSEPHPVTQNGGTGSFEWNGDLYFAKSDPTGAGRLGLWRMPVGGGDEVQVLDSVHSINWAVFERGICFPNFEAQPKLRIDLYEFGSGQVRPVVELEERPPVFGMSVSPDGRWILYVKVERRSDIMLVEDFR